MNYQILEFSPAERARQKQASREHDLERLHNGEVSRAELQKENSFFGVLDPSSFEIVAIGGRPFKSNR